jgi:putative membrane protein
MAGFLIHTVVLAVAIWVTAQIVPGITIASWQALAIGALMLAIVNAIVRPVLFILTLPITVLTLGLFYLVINGIAFGLAAALVPGFAVSSTMSAIGGALLTSVISWFLGIFVKRDS